MMPNFWQLATKPISIFVSPDLKLYNLYCHNAGLTHSGVPVTMLRKSVGLFYPLMID